MYEFVFSREQQIDKDLQNLYFEKYGNRIHKRRSIPLIIGLLYVVLFLLAFICFGYTGEGDSVKTLIIAILNVFLLLLGVFIFVIKGKLYYLWLEKKQTQDFFEKGNVIISIYDDKILMEGSNKCYALISLKKFFSSNNSEIIFVKALEDDDYIYLTRSGMFYFLYFKKDELSEEELQFIRSSLKNSLGKKIKEI